MFNSVQQKKVYLGLSQGVTRYRKLQFSLDRLLKTVNQMLDVMATTCHIVSSVIKCCTYNSVHIGSQIVLTFPVISFFVRLILEKEGPRSLFRGLGPNLVGVAPSRYKLLCYK